MFLRLGYGKERLFANLDAGYAIALLSVYGRDWVPGGEKNPSYNGLFFEPQVGWQFGSHSAIALGVIFQQSTVANRVVTMSAEEVHKNQTSQRLFTPAVTLRYAFRF